MQKYKIVYTPRALKELKDIFELILIGYTNLFAATSLIAKIRKKCEDLSFAPKASAVVADIRGYEFRFSRVKNFTIIYYIDDNNVVNVVSVQYSRRDILTQIKNGDI